MTTEKTIVTQKATPGGTFYAVLNLPDAPECKCGDAAGFTIGLTKKGALFGAYQCAKNAGADWFGKCDFYVVPRFQLAVTG